MTTDEQQRVGRIQYLFNQGMSASYAGTKFLLSLIATQERELEKAKDTLRHSELQLNTGQDLRDGNEMRVYTAMEWNKAITLRDQARADLRRFGRHKHECPCDDDNPTGKEVCICGFAAVLTSL